MEENGQLKTILEENSRLRHELENALENLKWTRDKLIEAQLKLREMSWMLVQDAKARGA